VADYVSVEDFQAATGSTADEELIEAAILYAQALIDARARRSFGNEAPQSVTVYDVRGDSVILGYTYTTIESVEVDGVEFGSTYYEELPFGIRFKTEFLPRFNGRGPSVTVTADFADEAVPLLIKQATIVLANETLNGSLSDGVIPTLPADIKSFSVEGLSITRDSTGTVFGSPPSTRNAEADNLVDMAVGGYWGIA